MFLYRSRSTAVGTARVKKMKARDDLLETMKKECLEKLANYCKGPDYPVFLKKLIVQGLIKIEEQVVEVQCRQEDKAIVNRVLAEAVNEYKALMTAAGHPPLNPRVTISDSSLPSKSW
jgi:V-type H+-transporting ATPase subunit E